jgi:hypothetical protein
VLHDRGTHGKATVRLRREPTLTGFGRKLLECPLLVGK